MIPICIERVRHALSMAAKSIRRGPRREAYLAEAKRISLEAWAIYTREEKGMSEAHLATYKVFAEKAGKVCASVEKILIQEALSS
jgi:hypothetical protein